MSGTNPTSRPPSPSNIPPASPPRRPPSRVGRFMGRVVRATGRGLKTAARAIFKPGQRPPSPSLRGRATSMNTGMRRNARGVAKTALREVKKFIKKISIVRSIETDTLTRICQGLIPLLQNVVNNPSHVAISNLQRPITDLEEVDIETYPAIIPLKNALIELLQPVAGLGTRFDPSQSILRVSPSAFAAPQSADAADFFARGGTSSISLPSGPHSTEVIKTFSQGMGSELDTAHLKGEEGQRLAEELTDIAHPNIIPVNKFHYDETTGAIIGMEMPRADSVAIFDPVQGFIEGFKGDRKAQWLVTKQVVSALKYLISEGLIHRDLQAKNVLVDAKWHVLLCDIDSVQKVRSSIPRNRNPLFPPECRTTQELREPVPITEAFQSWQLGMLIADIFLSQDEPNSQGALHTAIDLGMRFMVDTKLQQQYDQNFGRYLIDFFGSTDQKLNKILIGLFENNPEARLPISDLEI